MASLNPIDIIAGITLVLSGILLLAGFANLGVLIAGIGLLLEALKTILQEGL